MRFITPVTATLLLVGAVTVGLKRRDGNLAVDPYKRLADLRRVDSIPHYWTRVPIPNARGGASGQFLDVDITGDQFDKAAVQAKKGALYRGGTAFDREPGEYLGQAGNKKVMKMYCTLRSRVVPILEKRGQTDIAKRIEATG